MRIGKGEKFRRIVRPMQASVGSEGEGLQV